MSDANERLQHARRLAGFENASDAARAFGWNEVTYRSHENGTRGLKRDVLKRYAKAYRIRWEWLAEEQGQPRNSELGPVQIVGMVGAGGAVAYFGENQGELDHAPRPPEASGSTVAVKVRGDSMPGVAEDGWLIYYDHRVSGVPDEYVGELCVVWLASDDVFVKRVFRGRDPGSFDLQSTGYAPIRDVIVEFSAKVTWIKPR